jgi:cytochrome c-type biogenesis protein CcmH
LTTALAAFTAGVYVWVGTPQALNGPIPVAQWEEPAASEAQASAAPEGVAPGEAAAPTQAQIEGMVNRLATRLQTQPDDAAGWRMLARSYETLGRFDEAVQAYQRLLALQAPDADLLTDYAVTLGMSQGRTLVGAPEAVIQQALSLNPQHVQALALSGSASFEKRDYKRAIATWGQLLSLVPPNDEVRASIEGNVRKAEALAAQERSGATATR